ncbi:sensor histidine kinase [Clostridium magnum]|uniref:histidine kinase n=1 Tax=Clostridium magnum DSM 2767 TaxID=1121326 RepID=A0A162TVC8_9CLOT|nr:sensor histidine kinase [Clostridium magnum]KZL93111.1 sensor histidine kinase YycG [Clostridium magnum DSM 2767]SHI74696.1 Signal transduction histidine kinase [Clostridium magnum DSM 2767]
MRKGLFSKLVFTFTVIIAISFVMTAAFLSYWFESYYFDQRKSQLETEAQLIGPTAIQYLQGNVSIDRINEILTYVGNYSSADIWLTDSYGYVYAVSDSGHKNLIGTQILTKELEELRIGHTVEKKGVFGNMFKIPVHTFEIPIYSRGIFNGAIMMHTSIDELRGALKKVYEIIWISAVFAIIVSCIVIYYISQRIIIRPLAKINYVADKISKGEVEKRVSIKSKDEIGTLAKSFNSMADSLEEVEKNRREFISNVSHEIRSPITSIKGFIGGILDGVIPKEKENYYLSVAYEEIQRLTRLVNDLLDLSAIEAGQFKLRIEEIDINEIIRICVIKFETKIKEKKLKVDVLMHEDRLYVAADRDRLTQVVTNLIDNAIKYGAEEGNVRICTRSKGDKALISVFNDGPCIPKEDLKHIWNRFYKADKSRTSKMSTGLGLSIVRSILTQLGEDIWIENKENQGVTFTFTLKKV